MTMAVTNPASVTLGNKVAAAPEKGGDAHSGALSSPRQCTPDTPVPPLLQLFSASVRWAPDKLRRCTALAMVVTTPSQTPLLVVFSILDSIHKQSNTTLQAMLTLKVFSQKHVRAKLVFLKIFSINIFRLLSEVH